MSYILDMCPFSLEVPAVPDVSLQSRLIQSGLSSPVINAHRVIALRDTRPVYMNIFFSKISCTFLNELKFKLDIEKTICETNNTLTQFNKKWATIIDLIFSYLIHPIKLCESILVLSHNKHVYL